MSIMTRVIRIFRADLHGVMDQIEDKDLLLKQYLRELEIDLQHKEERVEQLSDTIRLILADRKKWRQEAENLERDIDRAIAKAKDDIARLLIRKKRARLKQSDWLTAKHESLQEEFDRLRELLDTQRLRNETLKVQVETLHVRYRPAPAGRLESSGRDSHTCSDEEIEIELRHRKEQFQENGRTPC
jgi:phage shock protein A